MRQGFGLGHAKRRMHTGRDSVCDRRMYDTRMNKGREGLEPHSSHYPRRSGPRLYAGHWRGIACLRETLTPTLRLSYLWRGEKA